MIKKFIPLLFVACGIVLLAHNAASADALSDALTDIKYRSRPDSLNFGVEVKYNKNLDNNQEIKDALAKWKQNCQSYSTSTFNSHVITTGMTKTDIVTTTKGLFVIHKCVITECKSGLHPSADGKGCEKDNNTSDGINNTATESDKDNKSGAKKTAKEKMDEHNQEYLAKQNASKLKTQVEQIKRSTEKLEPGDKLTWNTSLSNNAEVKSALDAWVAKCNGLKTDIITNITTDGKFIDGEYKCVIKACKAGYTPNKAGSKCDEDKEKKSTKEKMAEHNAAYQERQNASKLKSQIAQINKATEKLALGDKLKWNASFNDDAGIDAALKAWVDKCDTLATGNIAQTTVLGRESDGDYVCVIKTCKNGFNKSKSSTVCTNDPAAAEFADKFQEINDKFKSDVAAAWQAHNAAQAKSTK